MSVNSLGAERGAVVVETALILPFLIFVLAAILDFGIGFYRQHDVVQAVGHVSRSLSVDQTGTDTSCVTNPPDPSATQDQLEARANTIKAVCLLKSSVRGDVVYVKIAAGPKPTRGEVLTVCAQVYIGSTTGLLDSALENVTGQARNDVRLEYTQSSFTSYADILPAHMSWSFCQ